MSSQSWMDDSDLKKGSVAVLDNDEKLFWEEFIPKYLKPLDTDKEHEKQVFVGFFGVFVSSPEYDIGVHQHRLGKEENKENISKDVISKIGLEEQG